METFHGLLAALFLATSAGVGSAATVALSLNAQGSLGYGTRPFSASLAGLGLTSIASLTLTDDGTAVGGAAGIFSGLDLDGIYLDADGNFATTLDQVYASSFLFQAGTTRATADPNLLPNGAHPGPTFGSLSATTIDFATATLDVIGDGVNVADVDVADGFLTLGDGADDFLET